MKSMMLREIIKPVINRLGTVIATWLVVTWSADPTVAGEFITALSAVFFVGLDLFNSAVDRRKVAAKAEVSFRRETP